MSFVTGQRVVYGGSEICRIGGLVKKCFDGLNELSYFRLIPEQSPGASYYIPADNLDSRVRPLLTKEEIFEVIDGMPDAELKWSADKNERKAMFSQALKSDDYRQILGMMKALYAEKQKRSSDGKSLISADEKALVAAEKLIHSEFALVLGIPECKVSEFIEERLCRRSAEII